jgi:hypothetical protein
MTEGPRRTVVVPDRVDGQQLRRAGEGAVGAQPGVGRAQLRARRVLVLAIAVDVVAAENEEVRALLHYGVPERVRVDL